VPSLREAGLVSDGVNPRIFAGEDAVLKLGGDW